MQKYFNSVTNSRGDAILGARVAVSLPSGSLATIYSDNGVTVQANPMTTDGNGYFAFYAADGRYDLRITAVGIKPVIQNDILLEDIGDQLTDFEERVYPGVYESPPTTRPSGAACVEGDRCTIMVGEVGYEHLRSGGAWVIPNIDATALALPTGAGRVGSTLSIEGAVARTMLQKAGDHVNVRDFGAICDGTSRPLSTLFASLAAAQAVYPTAAALTDELDAVAIQKCFDSVPEYTSIEVRGKPVTNKNLFLDKNNITLDGTGSTWLCKGVPSYAIVFSAYINRALPLTPQLLELPYEGAVIQTGIKVLGLTMDSFTGTPDSSRLLFFFSDRLEIDRASMRWSSVNGVELRHCSDVNIPRFDARDCTFFGLFVYQCHKVRGGLLTFARCFQGLDVKQRHKLFQCSDHSFERVICEDMTTNNGGWVVNGSGYRDLAPEASGFYSTAAFTHRNFAGHEIMRGITYGRVDLRVTDAASGSVTNPAFAINIFADRCVVGQLNFLNNLKPYTNVPLAVGMGGAIVAAQTYPGATFGENHRIDGVSFSDYAFTAGQTLISYGGNAIINGGTYNNVKTARIIEQVAVAQLPTGTVESLEFRNHTGTINLLMANALGASGVRVLGNTRKFISGGNKLIIVPANSAGGDTICNPWYVLADKAITVGTDSITVMDGGSGASNHVNTTGMYVNSASGAVDASVTVTAPTTVTALSVGTSATRGLMIRPCNFALTGAPSGAAAGLTITGETTNMSGHQYSGAFTVLLNDGSSFKNSQNLNRVVWSAAAPTTGAWNTGDVVRNPIPAVSRPVTSWVCISGGTPGTWQAAAWQTYRSSTAARPVLLSTAQGVQFLDTTLAAAGKPIWWNGSQWVDALGQGV